MSHNILTHLHNLLLVVVHSHLRLLKSTLRTARATVNQRGRVRQSEALLTRQQHHKSSTHCNTCIDRPNRSLTQRNNINKAEHSIQFTTIAVNKQLNRLTLLNRSILINTVVLQNLTLNFNQRLVNFKVNKEDTIFLINVEVHHLRRGETATIHQVGDLFWKLNFKVQ